MSDESLKIVPGQQISLEQRAKLAEENARLSADAHRMAAEQRAIDIREGRGEPSVSIIAKALHDKLEKEDFQNKGN